MRCTATTQAGNPCKSPSIKGGTVCAKHGGGAPQVRARAAVRHEVSQWVIGDPVDDPGVTLLRLLTQSRMRADAYAQELEKLVAESPSLRAALVGDAQGEFGKVGEYIRGLVQLESIERDRCARFATKALQAGLAERSVRIAERQGELMAKMMESIIGDPRLGLTAEQRNLVPQLMRSQLAIAAGTTTTGG